MTVCDICGGTVPKVVMCLKCSTRFCENDGDFDKSLCTECATPKRPKFKEVLPKRKDEEEEEEESFY